jgi:hypothetical protein
MASRRSASCWFNGEPVGQAFPTVDVIQFALNSGLEHVDLDDPSVIRWVGDDKFTWTRRSR